MLDRAAELLPEGFAWTVVHVVDQRPEAEVERAIGSLPGRRGGLERIHQSVGQLQHEIQQEVETWLRETGRTAELVVVGVRAETGPHRFSPVSRFAIDHAPSSVLVIAPS